VAQPEEGVCRKQCQLWRKEDGMEERGTPWALPMPGSTWRGARPRPKRSWKMETHWVRYRTSTRSRLKAFSLYYLWGKEERGRMMRGVGWMEKPSDVESTFCSFFFPSLRSLPSQPNQTYHLRAGHGQITQKENEICIPS